MKITPNFSKASLALLIWAIIGLGFGGAQAQQTWSSPRIQVRFAEIPRPKLPSRLVISDLGFSDRVGGNGNSVLDAEEKVVVSFKLTNFGFWWSSSVSSGPNAWSRYLSYGDGSNINSKSGDRSYGFSVRCVKD